MGHEFELCDDSNTFVIKSCKIPYVVALSSVNSSYGNWIISKSDGEYNIFNHPFNL